MSWSSNGKTRSLKLQITKIGTDNSYFNFYEDGVSGFTSTGGTIYQSLYDVTGGTDSFARLSDSDFTNRLNDWRGYLTNKYLVSEPNLVSNIDFSLASGSTLTILDVVLYLDNDAELQMRTETPVTSTLYCVVGEYFGNSLIQGIELTIQSGFTYSNTVIVNPEFKFYSLDYIQTTQDYVHTYLYLLDQTVPQYSL